VDDLSGLTRGLGDASGQTGSAADAASALSRVVAEEGGLDGLVAKLRDAGLGEQVDSWIGAGPNQPIDAQQLGAALGDDEVQRLSSGTGLDIMSLLPMLAAFLPQIIDMITPDGNVPSGGLDSAAAGGLGDLGGLLGGLLGGGATGGAAGLDDIMGGLGGLLGGQKDR
jgi:uncharacterized protein YidB (DUF937 family)